MIKNEIKQIVLMLLVGVLSLVVFLGFIYLVLKLNLSDPEKNMFDVQENMCHIITARN